MFAWRGAARATIGVGLAIAGVAIVLSGGSPADPRTPDALPGMPAPFLGVAVIGSGGLTAAVDAYGDIVDLRRPGPAGPALVSVPAARQAAGSVAIDSALVPRVRIGRRRPLPLWRADSVRQHYLPGSNALRTEARVGAARIGLTCAAHDGSLDCVSRAAGGIATSIELSGERGARAVVHLNGAAGQRAIRAAVAGDRRWLSRARPLGAGAPGWARQMYRRSLLVLRALSDRRTGAVAAGARDRWAYVWPRDAGAAAIALAAAGYRLEARRVARFLLGLKLSAAARFRGTGSPVGGRPAQGDAWGWVAAAARAAGLQPPARGLDWRGRGDYQEGDSGNYLGNAIAATGTNGAGRPRARLATAGGLRARFATASGLVRATRDPGSGLDSAAAWAVRPFPLPALSGPVRRTLLHLAAGGGRLGIVPSESWTGTDPWTAPTAWTAWGLAALGERRAALRLLGALRRAATPAGMLPERVDAQTGAPRSTTPLAWSHAFAILALRELWPRRGAPERPVGG